jgi:peroxiredoxin
VKNTVTRSFMKTLSVTIAVVLSAGATVALAGVDTGEVLASHSLKSLDGDMTTLSSYRGEVVVVNFWASWCTPCRPELKVMNEWNRSWADRGARVVAISVDKELRNAQRFAEKEKLTLTVLHDGPSGLAKSLDLPSLPCTFVLDRDGKVVKVIHSSSSKDLKSLEQKVESMLSSSASTGGNR